MAQSFPKPNFARNSTSAPESIARRTHAPQFKSQTIGTTSARRWPPLHIYTRRRWTWLSIPPGRTVTHLWMKSSTTKSLDITMQQASRQRTCGTTMRRMMAWCKTYARTHFHANPHGLISLFHRSCTIIWKTTTCANACLSTKICINKVSTVAARKMTLVLVFMILKRKAFAPFVNLEWLASWPPTLMEMVRFLKPSFVGQFERPSEMKTAITNIWTRQITNKMTSIIRILNAYSVPGMRKR